jgi:hypothetical protein
MESIMLVDMDAVAAEYLADKSLTCGSLAARYDGLRAQDVASLLRLKGITLRRGNPNAFENSREAALATRRANGLRRRITELCESYGAEVVAKELEEFVNGRETNVE